MNTPEESPDKLYKENIISFVYITVTSKDPGVWLDGVKGMEHL